MQLSKQKEKQEKNEQISNAFFFKFN